MLMYLSCWWALEAIILVAESTTTSVPNLLLSQQVSMVFLWEYHRCLCLENTECHLFKYLDLLKFGEKSPRTLYPLHKYLTAILTLFSKMLLEFGKTYLNSPPGAL